MTEISDEIRQKVQREIDSSNAIADAVVLAVDQLPIDAVRSIAKLYADETRYLGQHLPAERERLEQLSCSRDTWCIGAYGRTCDGHTSTVESWCPVSGFGCPECEFVDELFALVPGLAEVVA